MKDVIPHQVWQDEGEEELVVDLEASRRLKKLRRDKAEVNGIEFSELLEQR